MLNTATLRAAGCDVDAGLARCVNNEALYIRLVNMALDDSNFSRLTDAVASGDLKAGFEAAHALKGVLGNLSLTKMYEKCSEITEFLRAKTEMDYTPMINELLSMRDELAELRG